MFYAIIAFSDLIPDGFGHKIPAVTDHVLQNCESIEVDVLTDREAANRINEQAVILKELNSGTYRKETILCI